MAVAQPVVDECQDLAGHGDTGDAAVVASLSYAMEVRLQEVAGALGCFDSGPAHKPGALFGDAATGHSGVSDSDVAG